MYRLHITLRPSAIYDTTRLRRPIASEPASLFAKLDEQVEELLGLLGVHPVRRVELDQLGLREELRDERLVVAVDVFAPRACGGESERGALVVSTWLGGWGGGTVNRVCEGRLTLEEEGWAVVHTLSRLVGEFADFVDGGEEVVEREPELPRRGRVLAFQVGQQELPHSKILPSPGAPTPSANAFPGFH